MLVSERFFKKFKVKENDCWEWIGAKTKEGYGRFRFGNSASGWVYAHRFAFEIFKLVKGEMPEGLCVCHSCDNPPCVNPNHLWLGTYQDNALDREKKGRRKSSKGFKHTEETKKKLSLAHKGKPGYWTGKKRYEETKQKQSTSLKRYWEIKKGGGSE